MKKIFTGFITLFIAYGAMAQWVSMDFGNMWDTQAIYFTDVNTGYAVSRGPLFTCLSKTTDGGVHWSDPSSGSVPRPNGFSLFFINADTGYIASLGEVFKTADGGVTWTSASTDVYCELYSIFFTDANTGYVVGGFEIGFYNCTYTFLAKTIDGGSNWITILNQKDSVPLRSVFFSNSYTGYTVGDAGTILKTTDGGSNWLEQSSPTDTVLTAVFFPATDTGYIVGSYGTILKTTDGGLNWIAQSSGTNGDLLSVFFTDVNTGYAVGGIYDGNFVDHIILKTSNGGLTWNQQSVVGSEYFGYCMSVFFPAPDTGYISTYDLDPLLLKTENGGGFPVGIINQNKNTSNLLISPNPASTTITIETPAKGSLSIHNTSGLKLLQQQITEPTTTIDVGTLPSGVYLVKVAGEKGVQVGKFIKM